MPYWSYLTFYEPTYQAPEQLFRRGADEGTLRKFNTRVLAVTYQGAIDAMLGYLESHPGTDIGSYADSLSNLLIEAVKGPDATRADPTLPGRRTRVKTSRRTP